MLKEFKEFAVKGNMLDMAVGIILGAAFGTLVRSLVDDVIMPPLGLALGGADFTDLFLTVSEGTAPGPYPTLEAAREAGAVTVNFGLFLNALLAFLLVAWVLFFVIRAYNRKIREKAKAVEEEPETEALSPQERLLTEIRDLLARQV